MSYCKPPMRTLQDNHEGHHSFYFSYLSRCFAFSSILIPRLREFLTKKSLVHYKHATTEGIARLGAKMATTAGGAVSERQSLERPAITEVEKEDEPRSEISRFVKVIYLALTNFCTKFAVDSIDNLSQEEYFKIIHRPHIAPNLEQRHHATPPCCEGQYVQNNELHNRQMFTNCPLR